MADIPVSIFRTSAVRSGTQPSNPAEVEGVTFPPVNPPGSGNATLYKLLGDTTDKDFIGKNGFVPVVNSENVLTLEPLPNALQDGLISGGIVQWTGTGYQFNVSSALARFQGVFPLQSAFDILTLTAADATNDRIDLFILQVLFDGDGIPNGIEADFITGTPAATPVKPQINPETQIELTQVLVPALSTTPTLTDEIVYDENTEWTGSSSGTGTANFASAVNPYVGTVSVETTNIQNGFYVQFNNGSEIDRNDYQTLGLFLDLKASMPANQNIYITFLNGSLAPVSGFTLLNFDKSSTIYQFIGIALSSISFTSDLFQYIRLSFVRTGGSPTYSGYFLDVIKLEGGINPPVQFGSFLSLTDTPSSYSGQGGKSVAVKADETGLEFVTASGGASTFLALTDTPSTYSGSANKFPRVNGTTDALIFDTVSPYDLDQEAATDGQVLTWVAANSRYEPVTPSGGGISGLTTNYIPKATSGTAIGNSQILDDGTNVGIGIASSLTSKIHLVGAGSAVSAKTLASFDSGPSPTAGHLFGITVGKQGVTAIFIGINKNTVTGLVPANAAFISTYLNDGLSLGRGNGANLPSTSDIYINGSGNVGIGRTDQTYRLDVSGNFRASLSQSNVANSVGFFYNAYNNVDVNPTVAYPILRIEREGKSGAAFASCADFGIARYEVSGFSARTQMDVRLNHGATANPDTVVVSIRSNGLFTWLDGSSFAFGTTTGTKLGTTTSQKIAFWNKTPIIQPTTGITGATLAGGGGTTITDTHTFGGYTLQKIAAALINMGILA